MTADTDVMVGTERWRQSGVEVVRASAPIALALLVAALVLAISGESPLAVYRLMFREAFGGTERIAATLTSATPVMFTGLATAIAFRAGVFNVGVEGSLVAGGLVAAVLGASLAGLPGPLLIIVALGGGALAGLVVAAGPALLRARWGVDEVVTTLMVNFIVSGVAAWLVNNFLLAEGVANSSTPLVAESAFLPRLLPPSQLSVGIVLALALVIAYGVWVRSTPLGYELRMVGANARFSAAHGIPVGRVVIVAMLLSGLIGGLGGGVHALGTVHRFVQGFSPGYGFTGIAVALLGRNSALGVVVASILFGALASAGATVQLFSGIPLDIVRVLEGTVMLFAVVQIFTGRRVGAQS